MALSQSQRLDRFAAALSAATGLTYAASRKWASAEVGAYNNLGIMDGPGKPHQYATPEEGAAGAAKLINSSPLYAGIRASVASKDTTTELWAIAKSPWHLGPSGLAKAGGVDPYYARIFGLKGTAPSGGSGSTGGAGYGGGSSSGGGGGGSGDSGSSGSTDTTQYSIIDWLTGKAEQGIATDFAKAFIVDAGAVVLGFIFVTIGLVMFLKGTNSPTDAIREVANDTIKATGTVAAAAVDPALAAGVASAGRGAGSRSSNKGRGAPAPNIPVGDAAGMRDSAPAGQSSETPRSRLPVGYYHNRLNRVRVTVVKQKPLNSGIKLVGPGLSSIPMPGAISLPGAVELSAPKKRSRKKVTSA